MLLKVLLSRLPIDPYIAAIVGMVGLASLFPAHGTGAVIADHLTTIAIALLFFLHGARLAPQAALAGARNWRLHVFVLASTFVLFPALALGAHAVAPQLMSAPLWTGLICWPCCLRQSNPRSHSPRSPAATCLPPYAPPPRPICSACC